MQQLQEKFELVFNPQQVELLNRALAYATKMHSNQFRESGEPYITHPIAVATILFDLGLDCATLAAALLHDCVEDTAATDEEIRRALETAQAAEFVYTLPGGLDYQIAQDGKNLSGGQRQRLTIARALVSAPDILILDDSSSALDFATDARLRKALGAMSRDEGLTTVTVSQRATAVKHCDLIVVLDDGKIAGAGKHEQLSDSGEGYREICLSQNKEEELKQ